jgi:hypothetical protein
MAQSMELFKAKASLAKQLALLLCASRPIGHSFSSCGLITKTGSPDSLST